ncbi:hypothetical protein [Moorena sp. SIO4G3]|uniref:hypothetical protein n=1 Tax=Moorena sp. SIO4G3 TaxID=2607821 RepID=UPI0014296A53|nr:hypothetical protein [Moorena sp. SIO4G3]NEO78079.1 hypothetical protein [Moorena sp. SIO4G3]
MELSKKSKLPKQVAPVQRPSTSTAISNQHGIGASNYNNVESSAAFWDILRMY